MKILVTAGPTCEDIDPVRFLTNRSSGRTGYAVAAEAAERGHDVVLVSGPTHLRPPAGVNVIAVRSADDMLGACLDAFDSCRAAILTAAVADYRPAERSADKIQKTDDDLTLRLVRTPDIAERLGRAKADQLIVGFALETHSGRAAAEAKLNGKNWDAVVLNHPDSFGASDIHAEVLVRGADWSDWGPLAKDRFAADLLDLIEQSVPSA